MISKMLSSMNMIHKFGILPKGPGLQFIQRVIIYSGKDLFHSSQCQRFHGKTMTFAGFASKNDRNFIQPLVLCGPSGSGKSSIMNKLTEEFPDSFGFSVSHTTRKPRSGEEEGVHYNYVSREDMIKAVDQGEFIENAEFSGNLYGTSKKSVQKVLEEGKICILDIDVQGVIQVKKMPDFEPNYVFIKPPSMKMLEQRLRDRKTETEESLAKRLNTAEAEMKYGDIPENFDIVIVNDDLDRAYAKLKDFMMPRIEIQRKCKSNM